MGNVNENDVTIRIKETFSESVIIGDIYFVDSLYKDLINSEDAKTLIEDRKYSKALYIIKSSVDQYKVFEWRYVNKISGGISVKKNVIVNLMIIIDQAAPKINAVENLIWTNSDIVTISGEVKDDGGSGIDYVVWSKDIPLTPNDVLSATENKIYIGTEKYSFTCAAENQSSTYYVYAVDCAGNVSEAETVEVKTDKKAPTVTGFTFSTEKNSVTENIINFTAFGVVCKEKIYVTISAADEEIASGLKDVSLYYYRENEFVLLDTKSFSEASDCVTFELTEEKFRQKAEICAVVTDAAGNCSVKTKPTDNGVTTNNGNAIQSSCVQIVSDKPIVTITAAPCIYRDEQNNDWYNGNVEFEVDVADEISGISFVEIRMNGKILNCDTSEPSIDLSRDFSAGNEPLHNKTFKINTAQNFLEGKNTIEVVAISTAEQQSVLYAKNVYVDTTKAEVVGYEITSIENRPLDKVLNFLTFGVFFNEQVKIIVTAKDADNSSGVKEITLYLNNEKITETAVNDAAENTQPDAAAQPI